MKNHGYRDRNHAISKRSAVGESKNRGSNLGSGSNEGLSLHNVDNNKAKKCRSYGFRQEVPCENNGEMRGYSRK